MHIHSWTHCKMVFVIPFLLKQLFSRLPMSLMQINSRLVLCPLSIKLCLLLDLLSFWGGGKEASNVQHGDCYSLTSKTSHSPSNPLISMAALPLSTVPLPPFLNSQLLSFLSAQIWVKLCWVVLKDIFTSDLKECRLKRRADLCCYSLFLLTGMQT